VPIEEEEKDVVNVQLLTLLWPLFHSKISIGILIDPRIALNEVWIRKIPTTV
jgi:hypothetical protein